MKELNHLKIPDEIPVDKAYTRTFYQEYSLLSNFRRTLVREISAELFENKIIPQVNEDELQFLLNYYEKRSGANGEAYMLRTIPQRINTDRAKQFLTDHPISEEEKDYIFHFYTLDEKQQKYILSRNITEVDEIKILKIFHMKSLHINNVQKAMIANILERIEELPKKNIFFANLYFHPEHKFFLPPNLKHVSGMTLTEAASQFMIATCHLGGKVPLEDVTFLLKNLKSYNNNDDITFMFIRKK